MKKSVFNPKHQNQDLSAKIVAGLERVSEVFKVLLWDYAKQVHLSPIQIQMLLFINYHDDALNTVSHLAKEFNITKPTVSDAVRVLLKKELVYKETSLTDSRSFMLRLTPAGQAMVEATQQFANPIAQQVTLMRPEEQQSFYSLLARLIFGLHTSGVLTVQRTCFGCKFYEQQKTGHFCNYLDTKLATEDIRLDCPEFEEKT